MTPNGTVSWEPMELRFVGHVEDIVLGGIRQAQTHHPSHQTAPVPGGSGEHYFQPGQEGS
jgi:hypothetical protein